MHGTGVCPSIVYIILLFFISVYNTAYIIEESHLNKGEHSKLTRTVHIRSCLTIKPIKIY